MRVAEVFGPTVQGEGPSAGRIASFVRLSGCNLDCDWCDTPYTWDWKGKNGVPYERQWEQSVVSVSAVHGRLVGLAPPRSLVVLTGGEPLAQQGELAELAGRLAADGFAVEVETNGTIKPAAGLLATGARFNVSPKLANSGVALARRWKPEVIDCFGASGLAVFKFVCAGAADVSELVRLLEWRQVPHRLVWVMPEGTTAAAVTEGFGELADAAIANGFNLSTRLHVLAWGDERGR